MNRRKSLMISAAAAVMSGMLVYAIYLLQIRQIELQEMVRIVVPKDFIRAGTLLTAEMVELKPIFKASYEPQMYTVPEEVVNRETLIPIGKGEPIVAWKINKFHLLPGEHQSTFQIPKEYIKTISNGIRAGDKVRLYVSTVEGDSKRLFDHEIVVASVKSSANIEVDDLNHPNLLSKAKGDMEKMYASRREANGVIDQINLNLTEEEWLTIDKQCKGGTTKLVIAFSNASITEEEET